MEPDADGVMLAEHEPLARVHEPLGVKTTLPVGVVVPEPEESTTTAVQLVA